MRPLSRAIFHPGLGPWRVVVMVVAGLVVWASLLSMPTSPPRCELDPSWAMGLTELARQNRQVGVDYIFTHGPLGHYLYSFYDADRFWQKLAWEVLLKAAFAVVIVMSAWRLRGLPARGALLVLVVVLPFSADTAYLLPLVAVAALVVNHPGAPPAWVAGALLLTAIVSLTKFTYVPVAAACVLGMAAAVWRQRSPAWAAGTVAAFVARFVGVWALCGQSPANIPRFLATGVEMAAGHGEAMALRGQSAPVGWAVAALALAAALIVISAWPGRRRMLHVVSGLLVASGLFVAWKAGFGRQDAGHMLVFCSAATLPLVLAFPPAHRRGLRTAFIVVLLAFVSAQMALQTQVAAMAGQTIGSSVLARARRTVGAVGMLARPMAMKRRMYRLTADRRAEYDLPMVRQAVGERTIDVMNFQQGIALLNGLNWHPRPVFQGYLTCTPGLLAANAEFLGSDRAPDFLLHKYETIDFRFPTLDDGLATKVMLRDYVPMFVEKGYTLLRRSPGNGLRPVGEAAKVMDRRVQFDEMVAVPPTDDGCQFASIDVRYSGRGKIHNLLYRPPWLFLDVFTTAGAALRFRIVPGMTRDGFLLDPLLLPDAGLRPLYAGAKNDRVVRFRITTDEGDRGLFDPEIQVAITRQMHRPPELPATTRGRLLCPMFATAPTEVRGAGPHRQGIVAGKDVLLLCPPGEIRFRVPPGRHVLTGLFGLISTPEGYGKVRSTRFSAGARAAGAAGEERMQFDRWLRPARSPRDRGPQTMRVAFRTDEPTDLTLRVRPGPGGAGPADVSFWTQVRIAPEE